MLFHHLRTHIIANDYALAIGSSQLELLCGLSTVLALYSRKHLRVSESNRHKCSQSISYEDDERHDV